MFDQPLVDAFMKSNGYRFVSSNDTSASSKRISAWENPNIISHNAIYQPADTR
jgi:hypothetical protein